MADRSPDDFPVLVSPHLPPTPTKMKESSLHPLMGTLQHISNYWAGIQRLRVRERKELWSARVHGGSSESVRLLGAILKRCKVRVRVSSTQLSPSELFIKTPHSSFSCYLNVINLAQPGNIKDCGGSRSIFIWRGKKTISLTSPGKTLTCWQFRVGGGQKRNPNVLVLVLWNGMF